MLKNLKSRLANQSEARRKPPSRHRQCKDTILVLASEVKPDAQALNSVIEEWLVPRLVEEFLREDSDTRPVSRDLRNEPGD